MAPASGGQPVLSTGAPEKPPSAGPVSDGARLVTTSGFEKISAVGHPVDVCRTHRQIRRCSNGRAIKYKDLLFISYLFLQLKSSADE
jgi:hypothetical protein